MDLDEYQRAAQTTNQSRSSDKDSLVLSFLGLAEEAGALAREFKRHVRDGHTHSDFHPFVGEKLGDLLWYIATTAGKLDLKLSAVAAGNLLKARERWTSDSDDAYRLYDESYAPHEQLPRQRSFHFILRVVDKRERLFLESPKGDQIGDPINDNAHKEDDYRFHDAFHLANAAILGWSPVVRALLKKKRKSHPQIDEVEDGARARDIEEGLTAFIFAHAKEHKYYTNVSALDTDLLRTVKRVTASQEVASRTLRDWERAILDGFSIFRKLRANNGGIVAIDLNKRAITFTPHNSE